jgi:hypothetical protein
MAKATVVFGIPIEEEMINVVNLEPGKSAQFLFYTVHFVDLHDPKTFPQEPENLLELVANSFSSICNKGTSGLTGSFLRKAIDKSRYIIVAIGASGNIGSFLLARPDTQDPKGIYVEASCNATNALYRENPLVVEKTEQYQKEVSQLTPEQILEEYNSHPDNKRTVTLPMFKQNANLYIKSLISRRIKSQRIEPLKANVSIRTAQLLKIALFNYVKRELKMKHAYNAASSPEVAKFHSRNGMVLRTTNCQMPDQIAETFGRLPLDERVPYMKGLVQKGEFKLDSTDSYPMKLCDYNFNALFHELLEHTMASLARLEKVGFMTADLLNYDGSY